MWHRAESIFKVAKACVVLSAHVLALNDQADFAFLELAVFAFDLVVKPGGENFVLRSKRRSEDLYPALATIESVHFRCFSYEPRWLERTTEHLCSVLWILHASSISLRGLWRRVFVRKLLQVDWVKFRRL
jgi:hypothetical protein